LPGVTLAIVGVRSAPTTNDVPLFAEPFGEVTPIAPVVAPAGTVTTSEFAVADDTVAEVPLNVTVFDAGVALKPVP
jgi:hypothetical protein